MIRRANPVVRRIADDRFELVLSPENRQGMLSLLGELDDLANPGEEDTSTVSRLDAARRSDEQRTAHLAFHRLNAARERGLAQAQRRCRARETAMIGEGNQVVHVPDFE